eukprot:CAMPEP_0115828454 /NCGR_PEP_ID=MMETSP0287-20121206/581_1 /TAXON_ID=412157 /ORGANISM="Chrysochromulina rotalis, Strain UIO044" /LENGTH=82 /DNA_ID=CAMNT_0003281669 /DNA_START=598 /DNA_END=846 /DNA_ORIENTATION=-
MNTNFHTLKDSMLLVVSCHVACSRVTATKEYEWIIRPSAYQSFALEVQAIGILRQHHWVACYSSSSVYFDRWVERRLDVNSM